MPLPVGPLSMKLPNIAALVAIKDLEGLQAISQHSFINCFYRCHFGLHDIAGVHGRASRICCTPSCWASRVRDGFFQQIGPTSKP
jgi:hypothetical protein